MKKIMIVCSSFLYDKIPAIEKELGDFEIVYPNGYGKTYDDTRYEDMTHQEYVDFFKEMYFMSREKISKVDACLVLNFDKTKNGQVFSNYIGASTFLEMYEAFMQGKEIYCMNELPDNLLNEELRGFDPVILHGDLSLMKR